MKREINITISANELRLTDNGINLARESYNGQQELHEKTRYLKSVAFDHACGLNEPCVFSMKIF